MQLIFFLLGILVLLHSSQASTQPTRSDKCELLGVPEYMFICTCAILTIITALMATFMFANMRKMNILKKELEFYEASNQPATERKDGMTDDDTRSV